MVMLSTSKSKSRCSIASPLLISLALSLLTVEYKKYSALALSASFLVRRTPSFSVSRSSLAASGGFGGGGNKNTKKRPKKKKSSSLSEIIADKKKKKIPKSTSSDETSTPKLDRFGLPIPTADDIFPPLPPGTEILPGEIDGACNREELERILENHLQVAETDSLGDDVTIRLLHKSPPVVTIDNFFTPDECQECIDLTTVVPSNNDSPNKNDNDNPVLQVNSATFSPLAQSKRTSTTWFCHYSRVPTLLAKAKHLLPGVSLERFEEPQVVRYREGEEFSWHYDEIPRERLNNGGQRVATLLVYLNDVPRERGGGTVFRDLSNNDDKPLTVRPKKGTALLFFPADKHGIPDDRTLHKGEVVKAASARLMASSRRMKGKRLLNEENDDSSSSSSSSLPKMIAQVWVHERDYEPVVPEGNSHQAAEDAVQRAEEKLGYR